MPIEGKVRERIESILSDDLKTTFKIINSASVAGGNINETYKIEGQSESFFVKINEASQYPKIFNAEVEGLNLLRAKSKFKIPEVISCDSFSDKAFLILEYLPAGIKTNGFYNEFGKLLADMHLNTHSYFGLDYDNYIGSLPQSNKQHLSWVDFFIGERIDKQLKLAIDSRASGNNLTRKFERLYKKLNELVPVEKPSLVHGDLWSGNHLCAINNTPSIFDPAVYYGHREMDLAMTGLFGGFPAQFYDSYNDAFPMEKNWEDRMDIHNLYPLMVHVNLFGGSYLRQVERILSRFV